MQRVGLGERLAYWRSRSGKTGGQVAEALGVSIATISRWETGFTSPTADNVERYAQAVGVTVQRIYGPLPKKKVAA